MKTTLHFRFILVLCLLCACEKEETCLSNIDLIDIHTSIDSDPHARVTITPNGSGRFDTDDCIRLFITTDEAASTPVSHKIILSENGWFPKLSWQAIHANKATFTATFPALEEGQMIHTIATDQRDRDAYQQSDLLLAYTCTERLESVHLNFHHVLSSLSITLSSDGSFSDNELASATVSIQSINQVIINPFWGTIEQGQNSTTNILAYHEEGSTYKAIVCPQTIEQSWRENGWIKIKIGEQELIYKAPESLDNNLPFKQLEKGQQLNIRIKLTKKEEENWTNKTVWIYGIENPPVNTWGYAFLSEKIPGLKWKPEYGWYDCNKINPDYGGIDSDMCWAATVSNMIHWWLQQNEKYISRYGKYNGPNRYNTSIDSEVFNYFKKHFKNTGNDVSAALNWFFTGRYLTSTKPDGAFFKDVLGENPIVRITRFGERNFTQEIQKAIQDREVIGCTVQYPRYLHAISLWGADFDSNGEVCAIYITDSNDRWLDEQLETWPPETFHHQTPAGIIRKRVKQKADGMYMESSVPGQYTFRIEELNLINLMHEKWEQYFNSHR